MQRFRIPQSRALEIASKIPQCFVCERELVAYPKATREIVKGIITDILAKNKNALLSPALLAQKQNFIAESFAKDVLEEMLRDKVLKKVDSFYVAPQNNAKLDSKENIENFLYNAVYNTLHEQGYEPIAPYNLYDTLDIDRKSGDAIFKRLTGEKKILRLSHKLFICADVLAELLALMRGIIKEEGYLDLNNFKKYLNLSRKYLITYLDYLDNFTDICNENGKRTFK